MASVPDRAPRIFRRLFSCAAALCVAAGLLPAGGGASAVVAAASDVAVPANAGLAAAAVSDTLVVRARPAAAVSASVDAVVTRLELSPTSGQDLGDALARAVGLQVRRLGGVGSSAIPSLRGSSAGQIQLLIDGVPLNDAQTGRFDLSRLPAERFVAAEIYRGSVPVGLGGTGGIGAVNLITEQGHGGISAAAQTGSFGTTAGRLGWSTGSADGRRSWLVMAHGRRADNDYVFTDHRYTFNTDSDDVRRVRENAWLKEWGVWTRGQLAGHAWTTDLRAGVVRCDGGRPGPLGRESPHASVRYERADGGLDCSWRDDLLHLSLAAARNEEYLYDPQREVGFLSSETTRSVGDDLYARLTWSPDLRLWSHAEPRGDPALGLRAGVSGRRQWYAEWLRGERDPLRVRSSVAAFAAVDVRAAGGRLLVTPAWRWQRTEDNFPPVPELPYLPEEESVFHARDDISPSLGVVWAVSDQKAFLETHLGRSVREPTWVELFGHRGGIVGNRELLPERIKSADLGLSVHRLAAVATVRAAVFYAETDAAVVFRPNSAQTSQARNIGGSITRGLELEVSATLPENVDLRGNLTWQRARDAGDDPSLAGNRLPYLPDLETGLSLRRQTESWSLQLNSIWQSSHDRDQANSASNRAPGRMILDLGVAHHWYPDLLGPGACLTVELQALNVTDNDVYDVEGYPLPGRHWRLAVRLDP